MMKDILIDFCCAEERATGEDYFAIQDRLMELWRTGDETDPLVIRFELFYECWQATPRESTYDPSKDFMHCPY